MPTYAFKQLHTGPTWHLIKGGFVRRSQAEAYARDYLSTYGHSLVCLEHDNEQDGIDIMAEADGALYQFAIDKDA